MDDTFLALYEKLNNTQANPEVRKSIREAIESNDLDEQENIPSWFQDFWQAILDMRIIEKEYFMTDEILHTDADLINCMAELADIIDMNYNNYGEGITMQFTSLNLKAFICLEGGPGACFYSIKSVNG